MYDTLDAVVPPRLNFFLALLLLTCRGVVFWFTPFLDGERGGRFDVLTACVDFLDFDAGDADDGFCSSS